MTNHNPPPGNPPQSANPNTRLGLRFAMLTHELPAPENIRLYARVLHIEFAWPRGLPGGGWVWQTPIELRVDAPTGETQTSNDAEYKDTPPSDLPRLWLVNRTHLILLALWLCTAWLIRRMRQS